MRHDKSSANVSSLNDLAIDLSSGVGHNENPSAKEKIKENQYVP